MMCERYFVVKFSKISGENILLGKYGHRVVDLFNDGYKTYAAADNLCYRKTLKALERDTPFRYSVICFTI